MARLLALEWDSREARVALATTRGSSVVIDDVFGVDLPGRDATEGVTPQCIGEIIAAALSARGIRRGEVLVAIGRASIELKQLSVPPAPDEELPSMVRFQASREFHSIGDDWPVDFSPLAGDATQPRNVLAATVSPELIGQMRATCEAAGLRPERLVLRPFALASLFRRAHSTRSESVRLLVDPVGEEADLTAMVDDNVVFLRTARLPGQVFTRPENARQLLAEVRRTMAAVQNQLGGRRVETIYVCGAGPEYDVLVDRVAEELGVPVRLFDATSAVALAPAVSRQPPQELGRFAPLLGMLLDEAEQVPHAIDFLNPRRPPEPPSHRNRYVLAAAAAVLLLAIGGVSIWQALAHLDAEIARLRNLSASMNPSVTAATDVEKSVGQIDAWVANDISWLDELRELSTEFPPAREAMLTQFRAVPHPSGGRMELEGRVRAASVVDDMERKLRDASHTLEGEGRQQDRDDPNYAWSFKSSVIVERREPQQIAEAGAANDGEAPKAETPAADQAQRPDAPEVR